MAARAATVAMAATTVAKDKYYDGKAGGYNGKGGYDGKDGLLAGVDPHIPLVELTQQFREALHAAAKTAFPHSGGSSSYNERKYSVGLINTTMSKTHLKVFEHDSCEKKLLGYIRVMGDCTYSAIRKEIMQDGIFGDAFQFVIKDEDDDDDEICTLNPIQEERWQVKNNKYVGIKRVLNAIEECGPSKRVCRSLDEDKEGDEDNASEEGKAREQKPDGDDGKGCGNKMLKSIFLSKSALQKWEDECMRICKKLRERQPPRDDKFEIMTEDVDDTPLIRVWCHECGSAYGKGTIGGGTQSSYSYLSNFMRFHVLESQAHQKRYLANRGLKVEIQSKQGDSRKESQDDCKDALAILGAIKEMTNFNNTHEATLNEYKDKRLVKLECKHVIDGKWLPLYPRGSDLKTLLEQHIQGKAHIIACSKESLDHSFPVLTGLPGWPRKHFDKDPHKKSLSDFLMSTKLRQQERVGASSITAGDSSSLNLNFLCWGLWQRTMRVKGADVDIKPFLYDIKMG
ncbi:hypothetical protein L7F22_000740 [Adiantum nelumboides]|nr:hypothetical protein [Adiantum nelumboides]